MLSVPTTNTPTTPVLPFHPQDPIIEPNDILPPTSSSSSSSSSSSPSFAATSTIPAPHSLYWDFSELITLGGTPLSSSLTAVPSPLLPPPPLLHNPSSSGHPVTAQKPMPASGNGVGLLATPSESMNVSGNNASSPKVTLSALPDETPTAEAAKDEERERAAQRKRDKDEEERTNMVTLADRLAATKKEQQPNDAYFEYIQKHSPRKLKGEPVLSLFAVNNLPMDGAYYRENEWRESGGQGLAYMGFEQDSRKFGGMKTAMDLSMGMYGESDDLMLMMSDTEELDDEEEEDDLAGFGFGNEMGNGAPIRTGSETVKEAATASSKSKRRVASDSGLYENSRSRKIRRGDSVIYTTDLEDDENELPVVLDSCSYTGSSPTACRIPVKGTGSKRWTKVEIVEPQIPGTESTKKRGRGRPPKRKKLLLEKEQIPELDQAKQHVIKLEACGKKNIGLSKASNGLAVPPPAPVGSPIEGNKRPLHAKNEKSKAARGRRASICLQETIAEESPQKGTPNRRFSDSTVPTVSSESVVEEKVVDVGLIVKRGRGRPKKLTQLVEVVAVEVEEAVECEG